MFSIVQVRLPNNGKNRFWSHQIVYPVLVQKDIRPRSKIQYRQLGHDWCDHSVEHDLFPGDGVSMWTALGPQLGAYWNFLDTVLKHIEHADCFHRDRYND